MSREEEKLKAADKYIRKRMKEGCGRTGDTFPAFIEGIEWADEHPSQDQIEALRMEYEKGRADAIAHPTGGELLHVLNKGHKQGCKEATDKLYEWVRTNHDEIFLRYVRGYNADDEIELLKKYMEEQQ